VKEYEHCLEDRTRGNNCLVLLRTKLSFLQFSLHGPYVIFDIEKIGKPKGGYVDLTI
jgi:hypothetical protein